jgi:hypothetical protein
MKKMQFDGKTYARIIGVGGVVLANEDERLTLHQAINAKSYQAGLPTRYARLKKGHWHPENMRCFLSLCKIRHKAYTEAPNKTSYQQPSCF